MHAILCFLFSCESIPQPPHVLQVHWQNCVILGLHNSESIVGRLRKCNVTPSITYLTCASRKKNIPNWTNEFVSPTRHIFRVFVLDRFFFFCSDPPPHYHLIPHLIDLLKAFLPNLLTRCSTFIHQEKQKKGRSNRGSLNLPRMNFKSVSDWCILAFQ